MDRHFIGNLPKVEKGIPVPIGYGRKQKYQYVFETMEVGDSFFVSVDGIRNSMTSAGQKYSKLTGKIFTWRAVEGGHRCWRTK